MGGGGGVGTVWALGDPGRRAGGGGDGTWVGRCKASKTCSKHLLHFHSSRECLHFSLLKSIFRDKTIISTTYTTIGRHDYV